MHNHYAVKNLHYKIHKMLLSRSWYTTIEYTRIVILGRAYGGIPGKKKQEDGWSVSYRCCGRTTSANNFGAVLKGKLGKIYSQLSQGWKYLILDDEGKQKKMPLLEKNRFPVPPYPYSCIRRTNYLFYRTSTPPVALKWEEPFLKRGNKFFKKYKRHRDEREEIWTPGPAQNKIACELNVRIYVRVKLYSFS